MVLLGYFYREAREAASIDAAWRMANEALSDNSTTSKSLGTAALKSFSSSPLRTMPNSPPSLSRPSPPVSTSYFASLSRHASNLASTVGLTSIAERSVAPVREGSLFEFSEAERQRASSILDNADAAAAAASSEAAHHEGEVSSTSASTSTDTMATQSGTQVRGRSSSIWSGSVSSNSVTQRGRNVHASSGNDAW